MTAQEYRETLKRLGLSISASARLFDVNIRTASRWASEDGPIPGSVAVALWLMESYEVDVDQLYHEFVITKRKK